MNDPFALRNMGKFNYDDIPTLGHLVLDRQRELLGYARVAHHEMPKLLGAYCNIFPLMFPLLLLLLLLTTN